jgi:hypothetical protein
VYDDKNGVCKRVDKMDKATIFNSVTSVLVYGSTIEDFKVCKSLCQGDPLLPFLFLIVAEELTGMVNTGR